MDTFSQLDMRRVQERVNSDRVRIKMSDGRANKMKSVNRNKVRKKVSLYTDPFIYLDSSAAAHRDVSSNGRSVRIAVE